MRRVFSHLFAIAIILVHARSLHAQASKFPDNIRPISGDTIHCDVETLGKDQVAVNTPTGPRTVNVSEIKMLEFGGSPAPMREAQNAAVNGDYDKAVQKLEEVNPSDIDREIVRSEFAALKLLYNARLTLSGGAGDDDDTSKADAAAKATANALQAGKELATYLQKNPTSMHYYEASETIGDLLASVNRFDDAQKFYARLAESPSPEYKTRASLLAGRVALAAGKYDDAMKAFDAVLAAPAKGKLAEQQAVEAKVGRTYGLVGVGKVDEAIKTLQAIIAEADEGDTDLLGRAYNALGNCYRKQKDAKQSLWSYLRVDLLYNKTPDVHAEALYNLSALWLEAKHPERSLEAKNALRRLYPYSRWAKLLK